MLFAVDAASVFGALWRLEPFAAERRAMWRREMEWLLSVSDFIVELDFVLALVSSMFSSCWSLA